MRTIGRLFIISLLAFASASSFAQTYPTKAVRLIVPFPPGGSTDLVARVIGQKMADSWGKQVVIDTRPGANGMIGSDIVAKANPDGYSIVLGTIGPMAINASLYKMPYDIIKDLAPISYTANIANVLVVNPTLAAKDVREMIALARTRPGQLTFGSSGTGGAPHMAVELFKLLAKVNIVHVPYKGGGPAMADLVSGLFTTAKTPPEIVNKLNSETVRILALPDVIDRLTAAGVDIQTTTPKAWGDFVAAEISKWGKVVKEAGVKVE